jgi:hypothetical protein
MSNLISHLGDIFPYDAAIDTPLGHRNLILIYCVIWGFQLAYAAYALYKWRAARRDTPLHKK